MDVARIGSAVCRGLVRVLGVALLLSLLAAAVVVLVVPRLVNGAALTVLTGSMTPSIPVGSVVLVRPVDPQQLRAGDVATYQAEDGESFITHRVVGVEERDGQLYFEFKGDANAKNDFAAVPEEAVRGEVWFHVPYVGAVRDALHGKAGLSLLGMVLLTGYAVVQAGGAVRDRRCGRVSQRAPVGVDRPVLVIAVPTTRLADVADTLDVVVLARSALETTVLVSVPAEQLDAVLADLQGVGASVVQALDVAGSQVALTADGPWETHDRVPGGGARAEA